MTTSPEPTSSTGRQRLSIHELDPKAYGPMFALEKYTHAGSLGDDLLSILKTRASQLNSCARCLDMHLQEARAAGVDQRKLDVLAGWHEAPQLYTPRERAALQLTEEVTLISNGGVSDPVWNEAAAQFSDQELVELLMAIVAINAWNRLAIATKQDLQELKSP